MNSREVLKKKFDYAKVQDKFSNLVIAGGFFVSNLVIRVSIPFAIAPKAFLACSLTNTKRRIGCVIWDLNKISIYPISIYPTAKDKQCGLDFFVR